MADGLLAEKFEIGDTEYQVQHGEENLEHQFDREDIYDIRGGAFDSSSMTAGVFSGTPTINQFPSNKFDNNNFSATDVSENGIFVLLVFHVINAFPSWSRMNMMMQKIARRFLTLNQPLLILKKLTRK